MKTKKRTVLREYDTARYLRDEETITEYFNLALASEDHAYIKTALSNITRARNMTQLSKDAGISRMGLYRALSPDGNPEYVTIQKIMNALNLRLMVVPKTSDYVVTKKPAAAKRQSAAA